MSRPYRNYTDKQIIDGAKDVYSIAGLLKNLGIKPAGGNYSNIKRRLQQLNINTDHWTGQAWSKDKQKKDWSNYSRSESLKPHLINNRGRKCELCANELWLNNPIPLEVHHIDGNRTNNEYENLQLLCPNCHSFTDNYRGKKNKIA